MESDYRAHLDRDETRCERNLPIPFPIPSDPNAVTWRVMCLDELESLIKEGLSLTRVVDFPDKLEGRLPLPTLAHLRATKEESADIFIRKNEIMRLATFVSCWRQDQEESIIMWDEYDSKRCKVAVRSSAHKLWSQCTKIALGMTRGDSRLGVVTYINPELQGFVLRNGNLPLTHKHTNYSWEREVRIVRTDPGLEDSITKNFEETSQIIMSPGPVRQNLQVNLDELIENVVLNPAAKYSFKSTVTSILATKNLEARLIPSSIRGG